MNDEGFFENDETAGMLTEKVLRLGEGVDGERVVRALQIGLHGRLPMTAARSNGTIHYTLGVMELGPHAVLKISVDGNTYLDSTTTYRNIVLQALAKHRANGPFPVGLEEPLHALKDVYTGLMYELFP